ncbi:hypothetical protein PFISCL1PPCAC_12965, partial [Pristionchus fissidentatus]
NNRYFITRTLFLKYSWNDTHENRSEWSVRSLFHPLLQIGRCLNLGYRIQYSREGIEESGEVMKQHVNMFGDEQIDPSERSTDEMAVRSVFLCNLLNDGEVLVSGRLETLFHLRLLVTLELSEMDEEWRPDFVLVVFVLIGDRVDPSTIELRITSESEFLGEEAIDGVRLTEWLAVHFQSRNLSERRGVFESRPILSRQAEIFEWNARQMEQVAGYLGTAAHVEVRQFVGRHDWEEWRREEGRVNGAAVPAWFS